MDKPTILLSEARVREHLKTASWCDGLHLHCFDSIDSTQTFVKSAIQAQSPAFKEHVMCCAETQTQGHGRLGRTWFSPPHQNLYFSVSWTFRAPFPALSTLSLVISLALYALLEEHRLHQDIRIKWPNDLLWRGKKIAGILIDLMQSTPDTLHVVIGIGLNVLAHTPSEPEQTAWCSMHDIDPRAFDRNQLLAQCITHLNEHINCWVKQGFDAFKVRWTALDALYGQAITVTQRTQKHHGTAQGINAAGELLVRDQQGIVHAFLSGEASIQR